MVSMPRRLASSKARSRFSEFPLVDSPTAMSPGRPNAATCRAATARRSSPISAALATVEARTWSSTAVRSPVSAYRNGYNASRSSLMGAYHGDRLPGVHQDRVAHAGAHQGHADRLFARPGVDHGHLVLEQPHHGDLDGHIRARDTDVPDA